MIDLGMQNAAYDYLWLAVVLLLVVAVRGAWQMLRGHAPRSTVRDSSPPHPTHPSTPPNS